MPDFYEQLENYAAAASKDERAAIEVGLWQKYGLEEAVFILDLSGFSRTAGKHGIVHSLSIIQRLRTTLLPLIDKYGGAVVKFEADNCFARFREPAKAIRAAVDCNQRLAALNATADQDFIIRAAVGIDYGWFLLVDQSDFFGMPVNIASKLGEDTAAPGQILVTDTVIEKVGEAAGIDSRLHKDGFLGLDIKTHEILYEGMGPIVR